MSDDITPEAINSASFSSTLRGFDKDEVHAFLATVAQRVASLQDEAENAHLNLGERIGRLLQDAKDNSDEIIQRARDEAAQEREVAAQDATKTREEADAYSLDTRTRADEYSRETRTEADTYAEQTRQEALDAGTRIRADADSDARTTRQAAETEKGRRIQEADESVGLLAEKERQVRLRLAALAEQLGALSSEVRALETTPSETDPNELTIEESVGG
ncbi:MAG: DivIVA domain-containing protein [Actinomycetota bacterium]|nr:DivIVA domain-containing protein [Actinomycetota bacterium]